jgi:hypothetical protein
VIEVYHSYEALENFHLGRTDVIACTCGRHSVPYIAIAHPVALFFKYYRELNGRPTPAKSATRCPLKQFGLKLTYGTTSPVAGDIKAATHVAYKKGERFIYDHRGKRLLDFTAERDKACWAIDIGILQGQTRRQARDQARTVGMKLFGKLPRIGWIGYPDPSLIHVDLAFLDEVRMHPDHQPGVEW